MNKRKPSFDHDNSVSDDDQFDFNASSLQDLKVYEQGQLKCTIGLNVQMNHLEESKIRRKKQLLIKRQAQLLPEQKQQLMKIQRQSNKRRRVKDKQIATKGNQINQELRLLSCYEFYLQQIMREQIIEDQLMNKGNNMIKLIGFVNNNFSDPMEELKWRRYSGLTNPNPQFQFKKKQIKQVYKKKVVAKIIDQKNNQFLQRKGKIPNSQPQIQSNITLKNIQDFVKASTSTIQNSHFQEAVTKQVYSQDHDLTNTIKNKVLDKCVDKVAYFLNGLEKVNQQMSIAQQRAKLAAMSKANISKDNFLSKCNDLTGLVHPKYLFQLLPHSQSETADQIFKNEKAQQTEGQQNQNQRYQKKQSQFQQQ